MLSYMNKAATSPDQIHDHRDYGRISTVLAYLYDNKNEQPSLSEAAEYVGLSEFHFQRMFRRWAGISPKQFCQYLTLHQSRERLLDNKTLLQTSIENGQSSTARLHDCFVSIVAMSPAEYRDGGSGLSIEFGTGDTPFGRALIASTRRGICLLEFIDHESEARDDESAHVQNLLKTAWPAATFIENTDKAQAHLESVFGSTRVRPQDGIILHTRGTNFQIRVWEALLQLPLGFSVNYETLAAYLDIDSGARAVASAVAKNPVGYLIPCHRVIRKTGIIGQYRWGSTRKHAILGWESARYAEVPSVR